MDQSSVSSGAVGSVLAASRSLLAVGQAKAKDWGGGVWRTTDDGEKIFISGSGEVRGGGPNGPVIGGTKKKPTAKPKPKPKPAVKPNLKPAAKVRPEDSGVGKRAGKPKPGKDPVGDLKHSSGVKEVSEKLKKAATYYAQHFINARKVVAESRVIITGGKPIFSGFEEEAAILVDAVRQAAESDRTLYRGLAFEGPMPELDALSPGQFLKLDRISSFSASEAKADEYAGIQASGSGEISQAVKYKIEMIGTHKSLEMDSMTGMTHEEYITHGQFEVVSVKLQEGYRRVIKVKQKATF